MNPTKNPVFVKVAKYTRDLLEFNPDNIEFGRTNEELLNNTINYIAIDSVTAAQRLSGLESYDGDQEVQTLVNRYSQQIIISFYGPNAYDICDDFLVMQKSQLAYDLQFQNEITIHCSTGPIDVKLLTGKQYINRLDVPVNVIYNKVKNISTLSIEELQYELLVND